VQSREEGNNVSRLSDSDEERDRTVNITGAAKKALLKLSSMEAMVITAGFLICIRLELLSLDSLLYD
jgi:hypothetical protein